MRKTLFTLFALLLTIPAFATEKPVRHYEVDAWGFDPDIYEFTPIGHSHMTCLILVSGGDTSAGITCFPKARTPEVKIKDFSKNESRTSTTQQR